MPRAPAQPGGESDPPPTTRDASLRCRDRAKWAHFALKSLEFRQRGAQVGELRDRNGNVIPLGSEAADSDAVVGVRRTTTAARLKAIYGSVSNLDGFTGMLAEAHVVKAPVE
jgi:hypothetical protein